MAPGLHCHSLSAVRSSTDLCQLFDGYRVHKLQGSSYQLRWWNLTRCLAATLTTRANYLIIKKVDLPRIEATIQTRPAPAASVVRAAVRSAGDIYDSGSVSRSCRTSRCRTLPVVFLRPRGGGCAASLADGLCTSVDRGFADHGSVACRKPGLCNGVHPAAAFLRLADSEI